MAVLTVRNVPEEVHRALKARAMEHGRSAEAEVRAILSEALVPVERVRYGDALYAIGRALDLTDDDIDFVESIKDCSLAEPMSFG